MVDPSEEKYRANLLRVEVYFDKFDYEEFTEIPEYPVSSLGEQTSVSIYISVMSLGKRATTHQLSTMLSNSKNVLFQGHNHLLTTSVDDPSL